MEQAIRNVVGFAVTALAVVLIASCLLMTLLQQREQARAAECANNLRRLGLGVLNYHATFKQFPFGSGGTQPGGAQGNAGRLSPFVGLLPFIEAPAEFRKIAEPYTSEDGTEFPSMGPVPWHDPEVYQPWLGRPAVLVCPSDPVAMGDVAVEENAFAKPQGLFTSYVVNYGDGTYAVGAPIDQDLAPYPRMINSKRGVFGRRLKIRFRDIIDGTSNTLLLSETQCGDDQPSGAARVFRDVEGLSRNPALCLAVATKQDAALWDVGRGARWNDGALPITGFQTVLPPNGPSCFSDLGPLDGVVSASSHHRDAVLAVLCDGSLRPISNAIDAGDPRVAGVAEAEGYTARGSESPYGVWGALGSRNGTEPMDADKAFLAGLPEEPNAEAEVDGDDAAKHERISSSFPLRIWKAADGRTALRARFVRIEEKRTVVLLDDSRTVRRVPLNALQSPDIFDAVRCDLQNREGVQK